VVEQGTEAFHQKMIGIDPNHHQQVVDYNGQTILQPLKKRRKIIHHQKASLTRVLSQVKAGQHSEADLNRELENMQSQGSHAGLPSAEKDPTL
jgi:hypothetical protein